jgi:hypothetical protein
MYYTLLPYLPSPRNVIVYPNTLLAHPLVSRFNYQCLLGIVCLFARVLDAL